MALIVADTADTDGSHLPGIIIIDLSYCHIELITNAAGYRLENLPLTFERHVLGNAESDFTYAYVHAATALRINMTGFQELIGFNLPPLYGIVKHWFREMYMLLI